jgi:hypothetical protein
MAIGHPLSGESRDRPSMTCRTLLIAHDTHSYVTISRTGHHTDYVLSRRYLFGTAKTSGTFVVVKDLIHHGNERPTYHHASIRLGLPDMSQLCSKNRYFAPDVSSAALLDLASFAISIGPRIWGSEFAIPEPNTQNLATGS